MNEPGKGMKKKVCCIERICKTFVRVKRQVSFPVIKVLEIVKSKVGYIGGSQYREFTVKILMIS